MLWGAMRFDRLKQRLDSSIDAFPEDSRIEPELLKLIGDSPVASLSSNFTNVAAARMQLRLYPVLQRYTAYTPYLDGLNAAWIRDQGPRFLIFDGKAIDGQGSIGRNSGNVLGDLPVVRRSVFGAAQLAPGAACDGPRLAALETVGRFRIAFPESCAFRFRAMLFFGR